MDQAFGSEASALESHGPGGSLQWKQHLSGHWSAKGLGGRYDIYPRGAGGYTAYWEQAGTGTQHVLGSYDTLGQAFGACRRHADGEGRQAAAESGGNALGSDVARKSVASAYGASNVDTVKGSGGHYTVTLKSGKRLHVAVDGSTGTVTDPDDGHVVTTHTVEEAAEEHCDACSHKHPKSVPTKPCEEIAGAVEGREKPIVIEKKNEHAWYVFVHHHPIVNIAKRGEKPQLSWKERPNYVEGSKRHIFKTRGDAENIAHHVGRYILNLGDFVFSYVEYRNYTPAASEMAPVLHEANDAGSFATMDRDTKELAKGHKLGKALTPIEVYKIVKEPLSKESQEVFLVLPLDLHGQLLSRPVEVARGQRDRVSIGISDVMRPVAQTNAKGFVVVHNHPSGHARPSPKDKELTDTIRKHTFPDVVFLDHIVVGNGQFFSFTEGKLYKVAR